MTDKFDIDFSFKKNDVDELFFNLSENPNGFKNKDFRYTLSLVYQIVEEEFEGVFLSPNPSAIFWAVSFTLFITSSLTGAG